MAPGGRVWCWARSRGRGRPVRWRPGNGRDALLIDLDERNLDLAYDRIGGLFLTEGEPVEVPLRTVVDLPPL